jgi:hypothetical protein
MISTDLVNRLAETKALCASAEEPSSSRNRNIHTIIVPY